MFSDKWLLNSILKKRLPGTKKITRSNASEFVLEMENGDGILFQFNPSSGDLIDIQVLYQATPPPEDPNWNDLSEEDKTIIVKEN